MATQEGVIDLSSVIYDVDPVVMVPLGLLILVLTASLPKSHRLSLRDSLVAFWYLFNGIIIHIFLDGCALPTLSFRSWPLHHQKSGNPGILI
jgi:hypothetical protein